MPLPEDAKKPPAGSFKTAGGFTLPFPDGISDRPEVAYRGVIPLISSVSP